MLEYGLLLYPSKELYAPTSLTLQLVLSGSKAAFGAMIGGPLTVFSRKTQDVAVHAFKCLKWFRSLYCDSLPHVTSIYIHGAKVIHIFITKGNSFDSAYIVL